MNSRFLFLGSLAVIALGLASLAHGQQPAANPTQIVLRPAAAPVPSLKYQIVPERRALEQGNAAIFYHRAIELLLQQNSRYQRGNNNDDLFHTDAKLLESWLYGPIASVPRDRVNRLLEASRGSLHEVELGARRQSCDWGLEQREEGVYLLVEEMQQMRALIRLVSLRARLAVIDRRMDDAMHWIQTGFAMARHTSDGPLLIQSLIGAAMSQTMCAVLEDLIQAPGVPSLYWGLAQRPRPLADFTLSLYSERFTLEREIPSLRQLDGSVWSIEQARTFSIELQDKLFKLADATDGPGPFSLREWTRRMGMTAMVLQVYGQAKRALLAQGRSAEQVEAMPAVQVAALHTFQQYGALRDDLFKWSSLPYYQSYKGMDDALAGLGARMSGNMLFKLFTMAIPAVRSSALAAARSERRLDAIQCIEAVRLHAAVYGNLPAHLEDIVLAPVPLDSATGKPFGYQAEGHRATISAPAPPGSYDHPSNRINYELKLTR